MFQSPKVSEDLSLLARADYGKEKSKCVLSGVKSYASCSYCVNISELVFILYIVGIIEFCIIGLLEVLTDSILSCLPSPESIG